MARFFETTKSDFVDKNTFQSPLELMAQVLQVKDQEVDDTFKKIDEFDLLLQDMSNLQIDDEAVNATLNDYRGQVDELAKTLQGDIGNFQKQIPYINRLKRRVTRDMQSGILRKAGDRFTERETEFKRLDSIKDVNPKRIADIKEVLDIMDKESGGLNFQDENTYNKFIKHQINPEVDFDTEGFLSELTKNFQADSTSWASSKNLGGGFIKTTSGGKKFVKESDVTDYITEYLNNSNFRSTNRQALELEGIKGGLRGQGLEFYVTAQLEKKEESLKRAAANRVGYRRAETSKSNLTVDNIYAQRERRAWEIEDKIEPVNTITKVERRSDVHVVKDSVIDNNFMSFAQDPKVAREWGLNMNNEREFLKSVANLKNQGKYKDFIEAYNQNQYVLSQNSFVDGKRTMHPKSIDTSEGLQYINRYANRGYRVPLVDKGENTSQLDYLNATTAVTEAILNQGLAQTQEITLVTNFGDAENPVTDKGSVLSLINGGTITLKTVGGTEVVKNVEVPVKTGTFWKDKEGNDVFIPKVEGESPEQKIAREEKSRNLSIEEAEALAPGGLKTTTVKNYLEELNKNPKLQSNVYRFKSANGKKDNYEVEVPIRYILNGKVVVGKAIIKTPTRNIEIIN